MRRLPILIPHRAGRADFPLPVLHGRASLTVVQMSLSVTRRQRKTRGRTVRPRFHSCQFSYPLSFRGQVCETQRSLPCFPSTVLSARHPAFLDRVPVSQVPRRSILCLCPALRPRPNRRSLASLTVSSMLPPRFPRQELQRLMNFGALSRGFGTCCLRFKTGVATTPARLASGWLARLYREGVEPSGTLQKVSDRSLILLFWIYPGAREVSF